MLKVIVAILLFLALSAFSGVSADDNATDSDQNKTVEMLVKLHGKLYLSILLLIGRGLFCKFEPW